jgi:simple sugar transport system permease protein
MAELIEEGKGAVGPMPGPPSAKGRNRFGQVPELLLRRRESTIAIVAIVLATYFAIASPVFLSNTNLRIISQYMIPPAILAAGQVMLLISGEIDLSLGNIYFMTPFLVHFAMLGGFPLPLALVVGMLGAGVVGVLNGVITTYFRVPSFITTLGMGYVINGFTLNISDAFPKRAPSSGVAADVFGLARVGGLPSGLLWAALIVAIMHIVLTRTRWGVYTIATGGNLVGATEAGVPTRRIKIGNFIIAAMLAGFVGTIEGIRIGSFDPGAGVAATKVFEAVSAAVIGGTLLTGGVGTIIGALLGALVISILRNGFVLQGISAFTYSMTLGAAIIVAMVLNALATHARVRSQAGRR